MVRRAAGKRLLRGRGPERAVRVLAPVLLPAHTEGLKGPQPFAQRSAGLRVLSPAHRVSEAKGKWRTH